jgi:hypothetical protein
MHSYEIASLSGKYHRTDTALINTHTIMGKYVIMPRKISLPEFTTMPFNTFQSCFLPDTF